jgi:hypothetical protein
MPQIPAVHQAKFDAFLAANGVASVNVSVNPSKLKPTQSELNQAKVDVLVKAKTYRDKPINVSDDGFILDGHHRWAAAVQAGVRIPVRRYSVPIARLVHLADKFVKEQGIAARPVEQLALIPGSRAYDFACHSAACRPPTSGGTGGSTGKAGASLAEVAKAGFGGDSPYETYEDYKQAYGQAYRREKADEAALPERRIGPGPYPDPHYVKRKPSDVMPMTETEATALVRDKDATGRRVLDKGVTIEDGQPVGIRANLNLKKATGVTIQTIHAGTEAQLEKGTGMFGGEAIGYQAAVTLRDVNFSVSQPARAAIAEGRQNKFPMASVDGHYVKDAPDEKYGLGRFDGMEVRFNPMKQHTFVDPDGRAVKSASEATVVGGSVFVRGKITYFTDADMPANKSTVESNSTPWGS